MLHPVTPHEIERIAKAVGLSINQVCRDAGVSRSSFTRWKRGSASVSVSTANKIIRAIAFHTSLPSCAPHALSRHHGRTVEGIQS
ncbi:helix-turn-helix transcriptional regulator [Haematospirillum sp. 15-248]|uniref:helix-turn-helix domain-containing protein n=1 Tax=Haematospirillum sp. 15-248 TaxID=2723107 RepID=UPI001439764A|nr:helix-turn-helix transcriptional regulator [Haematospirillum sp. 15-248]